MTAAIDRILSDYSDPNESDSALWRDLAKWAFSREPKLPVEISKAAASKLLDDAAARVKRLKTAANWASAARYFQAENIHGLEVPAAARSIAMAKQATRRG